MQIVKVTQALVVSIHDVAPSTQESAEKMIEDLKRSGIPYCSLLVIPHYYQRESLTQSPGFVQWLQKKEQEGHEIVLHGCSHLRPRALQEGLWTRWITQHYTRGEGEFYDLSYEDARTKLRLGKAQLEEVGCDLRTVRGFIAPAWLLSKEAERGVIDEGFDYTTRLHGVLDLRTNPPTLLQSQSMVYSVSSAWRRRVSLLWNELLLRRAEQRKWPLLRLGLHPPDWNFREIRQHALASASAASKRREVVTYGRWIDAHV